MFNGRLDETLHAAAAPPGGVAIIPRAQRGPVPRHSADGVGTQHAASYRGSFSPCLDGGNRTANETFLGRCNIESKPIQVVPNGSAADTARSSSVRLGGSRDQYPGSRWPTVTHALILRAILASLMTVSAIVLA